VVADAVTTFLGRLEQPVDLGFGQEVFRTLVAISGVVPYSRTTLYTLPVGRLSSCASETRKSSALTIAHSLQIKRIVKSESSLPAIVFRLCGTGSRFGASRREKYAVREMLIALYARPSAF